MNALSTNDPQETREPHSPDVYERECLDDGFSRGLGFFFQPSEEYWFDAHTHLRGVKSEEELVGFLDEWFGRLDAFRLGRFLAIVDDPDMFSVCGHVSAKDPRLTWIPWLKPDDPNIDVLRRSFDQGATGLKLHNAVVMRGQHPHDVWLSDEWAEVFALMEEVGKPVLWHVTQRMSASPYHGGGLHAYWEEGWKNGVTFSNEDLLEVMLEVMRRHPRLIVQGAHQLHIGFERLAKLFDEYENLYIDTSCAWFVRWADVLYDRDRDVLRAFTLKYSDRILFGSDAPLVPGTIDEYLVQGFLCHARCINQLQLPDETLQKVAHRNGERLYGLEPLSAARRGNYRP